VISKSSIKLTERGNLLSALAATVADYRAGELAPPTPEHVDRWVSQFEDDVQVPILREMDHVLKTTYFSRASVERFLSDLVVRKRLVGEDPCGFWKGASLLNIQQNGRSQAEMVEIFSSILRRRCNLTVEDCTGASGTYIYLDDGLFSGARIGKDLRAWLRADAPEEARVHLVVIATHTYGEWTCIEWLKSEAQRAGKRIRFTVWPAISFENRKSYRDSSEVLWPAVLPEDDHLEVYLEGETDFPFLPRKAGGRLKNQMFSSEAGRALLERELLLAGVKIRALCKRPSEIMRPLGYSRFGLGFGSMIVTFRNCPNNCPLALWWGDPEADPSHPFSRWSPLFPRKTYEKGGGFDDFIG